MKQIIFILWVILLNQQLVQAQGTVYLSNLGQTSTGSHAVGSDSWLAMGFQTGDNTSGYDLNSVQLGMTDASGDPSGFTVMLYSAIQQKEFFPGSSLGSLIGSANPSTAGIFIYTASNITLTPNTSYFIVLSAGTVIANGAYDWSDAAHFPLTYNPSDGWQAPLGVARADNYQSNDGSSWNYISGTYSQFAITATPVPEPSAEILLGLGGILLLGFGRWKTRCLRH